MKALLHPISLLLLLLMLGCGQINKEKYTTGDDPGEVNRANPLRAKGDQTGDGFTREAADGTDGAEVGPTPGPDSTRTDSTSVRARLGR